MDVAQGLYYLHSNGIVHLDIKSPNIMLTDSWQAKIADAVSLSAATGGNEILGISLSTRCKAALCKQTTRKSLRRLGCLRR